MNEEKENLFGVGLRRPHFDALQEAGSFKGVDFLEVVTENFLKFGGRPRRVLEQALERFPVIPHGIGLSIGSPDPLNEDYLARLKKFLDWLEPPWFSDHLSYSSAFGVEYHDLMPLPFTSEALNHVVPRIERVQSQMGRRLLLENPSYYVEMPGAEMSEAEFLRETVERADCGLLLDVNNVYVNAKNHGYDPYQFIASLPHHRVSQMHIAGHDASGSFIIDTHGAHISAEVFDLFRFTLQHVGPTWTLLEWDNDIPTLDLLLRENQLVRWTASEAQLKRAS